VNLHFYSTSGAGQVFLAKFWTKKATSGQGWTSLPVCLVSASHNPCKYTSRNDAEVALEREVEGDLFMQDIGQGFGFRPGSFDGAIRYATR
jgi:hypothetical protein